MKWACFTCLFQPRAVDNKMLAAAFKQWVEVVADDDHPLVIFHGMLVRFRVTMGKHTMLIQYNTM